MVKVQTNLKCKGCQRELPLEEYSFEKKRATFFCKYICLEIIEWICVDCWDKGVRYKEDKNEKP